jgi:hypothetical protein
MRTRLARQQGRSQGPARRPHFRGEYRQLKLAAVLRGVTVQTLVEHAIQEFLTNHPELLHSGPSEQLSKSPPRKAR